MLVINVKGGKGIKEYIDMIRNIDFTILTTLASG